MNRIAQLRRSQEGFTLIELLVVVAIIALLATFAVPKLFDAINKSKGAVGDADLQTISSAVERWYFEKNSYVMDGSDADTAGSLAEMKDGLKSGFVKANTTFLNGFGRGYMFFTDASGSFYVLVDPGNNPVGAMVTVTCGTGTTWTSVSGGTAIDDELVYVTTNTAPTAAQLNAGCTVTGGANHIATYVKHVTN